MIENLPSDIVKRHLATVPMKPHRSAELMMLMMLMMKAKRWQRENTRRDKPLPISIIPFGGIYTDMVLGNYEPSFPYLRSDAEFYLDGARHLLPEPLRPLLTYAEEKKELPPPREDTSKYFERCRPWWERFGLAIYRGEIWRWLIECLNIFRSKQAR